MQLGYTRASIARPPDLATRPGPGTRQKQAPLPKVSEAQEGGATAEALAWGLRRL
mgnify:CR=1 FL=1